MKNRLVFGAGYLGGRVVDRWHAAGDRITVVTRSASNAAAWTSRGISAVIADVTDADQINEAFARQEFSFDTVLYCVGYDRNSNADRNDVSIQGPSNAITALSGRFKHWIFTSSTSCYGQTDGDWVDESSPVEPSSENGQRCVAAEQAVREAAPSNRLLIMRLAGLYGPDRTLARKETLLAEQAIPGSGEQWLNLIHVDDAADAATTLADLQYAGLVLGSDNEPVQRADYYKALAALMGAPSPRFDGEERTSRGANNKRCQNALLRSLLNRPLQFPTYREGLQQIIGAKAN